jgi:DNA-binding MurR/RpiR family transcriptional regulator
MGIQSTIEASIASLSPAARRVAQRIKDDPSVVLDRTISELAAACRTSVATVVRFCHAVGLSGYAELRMSLAQELGKESAQFGAGMTLGAEIARSDTLQEMAGKVATLEMLAIDETVTSLDYKALERIVKALDRAQRILLFGIGASHFVAQDLHHKLFRIGRNTFLMSDAHEAWSAASQPPERTVAIGFSHSGVTTDTVKYLDLARQNGALAVAVTSVPQSPLAAAASVVLIVRARERALRAGAMVSRIAQLALVDCLFLGVARLRYEETIAALQLTMAVSHPDASKARRRPPRK